MVTLVSVSQHVIENCFSHSVVDLVSVTTNWNKVESPLTGHYRDQGSCPFNRGDNYKDYVSVLPSLGPFEVHQ